MATAEVHDLKVYQLAMRAGEAVWSLTAGWDWLAKQTVGLQWIRSADSIATSISEGHARCSAKEGARFYADALGHLSQTQTWLEKVVARKLVPDAAARELSQNLDTLRRLLSNHAETFDPPSFNNPASKTSRGGSIHLLPLEEFFHPQSSDWNA